MQIEKLSFDDVKKEDLEILERKGTIFHSYAWNKAIVDSFDIKCDVYLAKEDNQVKGAYLVYPSRFYKLFRINYSPNPEFETVYGGPIAEDKEILKDLAKQIGGIAHVTTAPLEDPKFLEELRYRLRRRDTCIIKLGKKEEELWNNISKSVRKKIKRAERYGIEIFEGDLEDLDEYYKMLTDSYKRLKLPLLKKEFYENLLKLVPKDNIKLYLARYSNKIIAGAIFLCFNDISYYWSTASYKEYWHLNANHLIQWNFLRWANFNGIRYHDLLGAEIENVTVFKNRFGGERVEFYSSLSRMGAFLKKFKF